MRLYKRLERFTWGFYTRVHHQVPTLWGACLSYRDKSLLWCHRTSTTVVNGLFRAICAAARFTWGFYTRVCHQVQTLWGACLGHRDKSLLWCHKASTAVENGLFHAIRAAAWFIWGFCTRVRHQGQTLWGACLSHRDRSLLWCHRTSTAVANGLFWAICAAAWFAKVCWTVISATYEVLKEPPSPLLSSDHTRDLEPRRNPPGRWITEPEDLDSALFSPNDAPVFPVESTSWSTTGSPESLLPLQLEKQLSVSQGSKKSEPRSPAPPQSVSLALSSLTIKEVVETKAKSDRFSLEPVCAPMLVPSTSYRPVEGSIRQKAPPRIRAKDTVRVSSHKSLQNKARTTSGLSGISLLSSPPRKRLHSVNQRQIDVAATADRLEAEKNGVNVATVVPEQTRVTRNVSTTPAVPILGARKSPMVTTDPTAAALSVPTPPHSLSVTNSLLRAGVSRPAVTLTYPTPPQQIQSITTIDQSLLHTHWYPSVAAPNSNEPILQSGTGAAGQAGVSTAEGMALGYSTSSICAHCSVVDSLAHVRSHQTQQTSAQGKQHPSPSVVAPPASLWPTMLQPGSLATTIRQVASNVEGWSPLVPPF